jgi:hypothetical protein
VTNLKEYIMSNDRTRRRSRTARHPMREEVGDVRVVRSPGLDTASVALPASIDLDDRADRMNEFWRALVEFQHRDVLVVALAVGEER